MAQLQVGTRVYPTNSAYKFHFSNGTKFQIHESAFPFGDLNKILQVIESVDQEITGDSFELSYIVQTDPMIMVEGQGRGCTVTWTYYQPDIPIYEFGEYLKFRAVDSWDEVKF